MENYELTTPAVKPVVLGEFGAFKYAYPDASDADRILRSVQAESCTYGLDGWLHWSWDTTEFGAERVPAVERQRVRRRHRSRPRPAPASRSVRCGPGRGEHRAREARDRVQERGGLLRRRVQSTA